MTPHYSRKKPTRNEIAKEAQLTQQLLQVSENEKNQLREQMIKIVHMNSGLQMNYHKLNVMLAQILEVVGEVTFDVPIEVDGKPIAEKIVKFKLPEGVEGLMPNEEGKFNEGSVRKYTAYLEDPEVTAQAILDTSTKEPADENKVGNIILP